MPIRRQSQQAFALPVPPRCSASSSKECDKREETGIVVSSPSFLSVSCCAIESSSNRRTSPPAIVADNNNRDETQRGSAVVVVVVAVLEPRRHGKRDLATQNLLFCGTRHNCNDHLVGVLASGTAPGKDGKSQAGGSRPHRPRMGGQRRQERHQHAGRSDLRTTAAVPLPRRRCARNPPPLSPRRFHALRHRSRFEIQKLQAWWERAPPKPLRHPARPGRLGARCQRIRAGTIYGGPGPEARCVPLVPALQQGTPGLHRQIFRPLGNEDCPGGSGHQVRRGGARSGERGLHDENYVPSDERVPGETAPPGSLKRWSRQCDATRCDELGLFCDLCKKYER
mmetsp:Transcript_23792/g.52005  ORF Transcript_23792/g.52005 Transcript_23792/m.52005 type:complete len:339 (-) Transcript_23792:299-1315(-)